MQIFAICITEWIVQISANISKRLFDRNKQRRYSLERSFQSLTKINPFSLTGNLISTEQSRPCARLRSPPPPAVRYRTTIEDTRRSAVIVSQNAWPSVRYSKLYNAFSRICRSSERMASGTGGSSAPRKRGPGASSTLHWRTCPWPHRRKRARLCGWRATSLPSLRLSSRCRQHWFSGSLRRVHLFSQGGL